MYSTATAIDKPCRFALVALAACFFAIPLAAQDIEQYRPLNRYRYLPRLPEGGEDPPPLPETETEITGSNEKLLDNLKGLVFVDHPDKLQNVAPITDTIQVDASDPGSLLHTPEFRSLVDPYLTGPVSIRRLNTMARDIILFYRNNDEPVVDVSIPQQDVTDRVLQVVVTESIVGRVRVEGSRYFDSQNLVDQVYISPGDPILESDLLEDQRWLMRNPFRDVHLKMRPGENRGETDVIFEVQDRRPTRFYAGYEDTGNQITGLERTIYGVNWYNAFNKDDQFGYQYTASSDFETIGNHSAIYSLALLNRDIITVFGSYGEAVVPPSILNPFDNTGKFWHVSARWDRELCPHGCWEHGVQTGFDFKNTNTALDFGGVLVFDTDADIIQMMSGYHARRYDDYGSTHLRIDGYFSPGGLSGKNDNATYQQINPGSKALYGYGRGIFEQRLWLPRGYELVGRAVGQVASTNLLPPEALGLGGYNSVRGYDQFTFAADTGFFANIELWSAPITCLFGDDELRFLAFYDIASAARHTHVDGIADSADFQSVGVGMRYDLGRSVQVRSDYGWQLRDVPGISQPDSRIHIGAVISY